MDEKERDFLADYADEDGEAEEVEKTEPEKPEPEVEKDVKTEPEPAQPEASSAPEPAKEQSVPLAALQAERKKRQEYEARLREFEQAREQQIPQFNEDPEQHVHAIIARERQQMMNVLYASMEAAARESYGDYDEVFQEVEQYVRENPAALHELQKAANPAIAAYKLGKRVRELRDMQDPDAYRQKIEAEVRAKIDAEIKAREQAKEKVAQALPPDLSSSRGAKGEEAPEPSDVFDSVFQS